MKTIQTGWMMALLMILLISMAGQIVLNWGANLKLVLFNGIGTLLLGTALIFIRKR